MKRHGQFWFSKTAATTAVLMFPFACAGWAAPAVSNRYLFLIDTSFSMTRIDTPVRKAVGEMVREGLGGRMRTGDTFGLWTFNEQTHTDFPLQTWNADGVERQIQAIVVDNRLKQERFEKTTRLNRLWPEVAAVIQSAGDVTVFLLSDGDTPMQDTPFDAEINAAWEKIARDMHRARKPIVTTLVARERKIVRWAVNSPTEVFAMPAIPTPKVAVAPPVKIEKPPAPVAVVAPPPVVKPAPTKIKPPAVVENRTPAPAPVAIVAPPKPIVIEKPPVIEKPVELKQLAEEKPVEIKPQVNPPAPVVTPPVVVVQPPAVVPVKSEPPKPVLEIKPPAPRVEAPKEIVVAKAVMPEAPKPAVVPPAPPAPKPVQQVVTAVTPAPVVEKITPAPTVVVPPVAVVAPPVGVEKKAEPPKPVVEIKPTALTPIVETPKNLVVAKPAETAPPRVAENRSLQPTPVTAPATTTATPEIKSATPAPTLAAVVPSPEARFSSRGMLRIGGVLLAAAGLTVLLLARRSRTPQPSLISRSMGKK